MGRESKTPGKKPKERKPITMPQIWVQGFMERRARLIDYINSGRSARGVPDGYVFNEQAGTFAPQPEQPKGG